MQTPSPLENDICLNIEVGFLSSLITLLWSKMNGILLYINFPH